MCYVQCFCCCACGNIPSLPPFVVRFKFLRFLHGFYTKAHAFGFCCCNPLSLTLFYEFAFCLRHIGQQLQYDVSNEGAGQITALPHCIRPYSQKEESLAGLPESIVSSDSARANNSVDCSQTVIFSMTQLWFLSMS